MLRAAILSIAIAVIALSLSSQTCSAREPGRSRQVVASGSYRQQIRSKPIVHRPYRPMHFYGNTVRRIYHRRGR